jgi:hypothetical protein
MKFKKEHPEQTIFDLLFPEEAPASSPTKASLRDKVRGILPVAAEGTLLSVAIEGLADRFAEKDTKCPACGGNSRQYNRALNGTMGGGLCWLVKEWEADLSQGLAGWVCVPERGPKWMTKSNQHSSLSWWGLVEKKTMTREEQEIIGKKDSGLWRPTLKGVDFAKGKIPVLSHAHTYRGVVLELHGDEIYIHDVKGLKFNYNEVMS